MNARNPSQPRGGEVQMLRLRISAAEAKAKTAKAESRAAKRRRKEAKRAAQSARKRFKQCKAELAELRDALAKAEAKLSQADERAAKARKARRRTASARGVHAASSDDVTKASKPSRPRRSARKLKRHERRAPPPPVSLTAELLDAEVPVATQQADLEPATSSSRDLATAQTDEPLPSSDQSNPAGQPSTTTATEGSL